MPDDDALQFAHITALDLELVLAAPLEVCGWQRVGRSQTGFKSGQTHVACCLQHAGHKQTGYCD